MDLIENREVFLLATPRVIKKKKKKNGIDLLKDDCSKIILRDISLVELFTKLDKILEYSLSYSLNRLDLLKQIKIVDSVELARVILFCLDNFDLIDIADLEKLDIDKDLLSNIRYIISKYGPRYNQLRDADVNQFGWKNVRHSIVKRAENSYVLEFKVYLYNGEIVIIQDDAESMIQLASSLVEGVSKMNGLTEINREPVNKLLEGTNQLLDDLS